MKRNILVSDLKVYPGNKSELESARLRVKRDNEAELEILPLKAESVGKN